MTDIIRLKGKTRNSVADLKIEDLNLAFGSDSHISGTFYLPDFERLEKEDIRQSIKSYKILTSDLESIRMPDSMEERFIRLPEAVRNLGYVSGYDLRVNGKVHDLWVDLHTMNTGMGDVNFTEPFRMVSDTTFASFEITPQGSTGRSILITELEVGRIIGSSEVGVVNGSVGLKSVRFDEKGIRAQKLNGVFDNTALSGYKYKYIFVKDLDYTLSQKRNSQENNINGLVYVRDENLDLTFNGSASFGNEILINALLDIECAHLYKIHPSLKERGELYASLKLFGSGRNFKTFSGSLEVDTLFYSENGENFAIDHLLADLKRTKEKDLFSINSNLIDARMEGKVDFMAVKDNILYQIASIFPAFLPDQREAKDPDSSFDYEVHVKRINPVLDVLVPKLQIADNTDIVGSYNGAKNTFNLNINSKYIAYAEGKFQEISMTQEFYNDELLALYKIDSIYISDSLAFQEIHFTGLAADGFMDSQLIFHDTKHSRSNLQWYTHFYDKTGFEVDIRPSYFTIRDYKWNLNQDAYLKYSDECILVEDFKLQKENQYIAVNGQVSEYPSDHLNLDIMNLNLADVSAFMGTDMDLSGKANIVGYISEPFDDFKFSGEAIVENLFINKTEVGDISFAADYLSEQERIKMFGDIFFKGEKTFAFDGHYNLAKKVENKLDFSMIFRNTDISVVNEFLDPDVVSGIEGKLKGSFDLKGTIEKPELTGKVDFNNGKANLTILGADFFFDGKIESVVDGFYINQMPLTDEEGNTGFVNGSLFHDNFDNFFFELFFNLRDHPTRRDPKDRSKPEKIERFLVMKTEYSEDSPYYGTAYVTGTSTVSGYTDNLTIEVDAKTQRGTKINFPMYGPTTIEEEEYITFKKPESDLDDLEKEIDFTGVDLSLNFDVTPDAKVRLIFDETIGDELNASGEGNIRMTLDQYNDLAINGTYTVADGVYNFVMGPYKQNFNIAKGGTVRWSGDPYSAYLDIQSYYKTSADLSVVMPNVLEGRGSENEEILAYLKLEGEIMNPEISFDIEAPKATETEKAVISRIKSDQDELNRQFFALIITKGFLPLSGQGGGGGGSPILDLAETQINSVLGKVSEDYKMNVNLQSDQQSGQVTGEFGISKGFLNDRLLVSGSFGVSGSSPQGGPNAGAAQNNVIGDVEVEYLLNEPGTFRVSAFNESNANQVIQVNNRGQFTQGIGVSYKEDFHTLEDFKLFQFIANLFRKKENRVKLVDKQNKKVPIPKEYLDKNGIKEEE